MSTPHSATLAARAGIDRDSAFGAVVPPIVLSSNFSFAGFEQKRQYDYTRSGNPTRDLLAEALAELEGGAGAVVTASGMAAITLVLNLLQPGQGLDIGCGAGRDAVYLAMHGWQMTGIDYLPGALQRARQLAASQQVALNTLAVDLETGKDPFTAFTTGQFELICVARYLHRPLFPWIKRILKPGGVLIYQTFMQGAEQFGSPRNPNFLLKSNELSKIFADGEIWLDDVEYLDDGRPVSAFICRYE